MKPKKLRIIISILLAAMLVLGIAACGKTIGTGNNEEAVVRQETTKTSEQESASKKTDKEKEETTKAESSSEEQNTSSENSSGNSGSSGSTGGAGGGNSGSGSSGGGNSGGGNSGGGGYTPAPTQPETEATTEAPTQPPAPTWTVSVTVDGAEYGGIFAGGTYTYYYQPSAFDVLVSTGLPYTGSGYYVSSINGLAEFDHGMMSGWLYSVNGVFPGIGCGDYYLNDGDSVYWLYHSGDE